MSFTSGLASSWVKPYAGISRYIGVKSQHNIMSASGLPNHSYGFQSSH